MQAWDQLAPEKNVNLEPGKDIEESSPRTFTSSVQQKVTCSVEKGGRGKMTFRIAPLSAKKNTTVRTICQLQSPTEEEMLYW